MKVIKDLSALLLLIILPLLYFSACSDKKDVNSPLSQDLSLTSPSLAVLDITDAENGVQDATVDSDMSFNSALLNYTFLNSSDEFTSTSTLAKGNPWLANFDFKKHLGWVFNGMQLSQDQKTAIKGFLTTYHDSMKVYVKAFYNANKDTIANANAKRKVIVDSVKAGLITRLKAEADIVLLNQVTRTAISNNPLTVAIKAEMCADRSTLFQKIASILNASQLIIWNQRISQIKSPC
jgi:hypothetical protein